MSKDRLPMLCIPGAVLLLLIMCVCFGSLEKAWASDQRPTAAKAPATVAGAESGPMKVVFINPGISDPNDPTGAYWSSVTAFMQETARQLHIDLEVIYSERDHIRMRQQGRDVAKRSPLPDYLIVVNEKQAADEMVKAADQAGLKIFLMGVAFYGEQAKQMGAPREKYQNWIGSLVPDNRFAGYQVAKSIIDRAMEVGVTGQGPLRLLAIAGDAVTQASRERVEGLKQAVSEYPNVELQQVFMGEWRLDRAREQTKIALSRYPDSGAVWAANDPMALGAMEGALEAKRKPGKDILIGGLNWDPPALEKIRDGSLVVSVGGHFMIGGWTLVLLYDYHHGKDFADEGVELQRPIFGTLNARNIEAFFSKYGDRDWSKIDFRRFSRVCNPAIIKYDFGVVRNDE